MALYLYLLLLLVIYVVLIHNFLRNKKFHFKIIIALSISLIFIALFQNIKNIGNTVSATIPIAIKQAIDGGLYKKNMNIMLMGFGVGLSVAGCVLRS